MYIFSCKEDESNYFWGTHRFRPLSSYAEEVLRGVYFFGRYHYNKAKLCLCWDIYYVGQSKDIRTRFKNHEKIEIANQLGAGEPMILIIEDKDFREQVEEHMIKELTPILNETGKKDA